MPDIIRVSPFKLAFGTHFRGVTLPQDKDIPADYQPAVDVSDILASVCSKGVLKPVHAWRDPNLPKGFDLRLVDGMRRVTALKKAITMEARPDDDTVPVIIDDDVTDEEGAIVRGGMLNLGARRPNRYEVGGRFDRLRESGWSIEKIALAFSVTEQQVRNYITMFRRLAPQVKAALDMGSITVTEAMGFSTSSKDRQVEDLLALLAARDQSEEEAQQLWQRIQRKAGIFRPVSPAVRRAWLLKVNDFIEKHKEQPEWGPFVQHALIAKGVLEADLAQRTDIHMVLFGYKEEDAAGGQG